MEWYWVEYLCPRQGPYWQAAGGPFPYQIAVHRAQIVKPPLGSARVIDQAGRIVYSL